MINSIKKAKNMNALERVTAPTPKFFRIVRTIGLTLAAAGGAILAALVTVAGYITVAGAVATAVSQAVVDEEKV